MRRKHRETLAVLAVALGLFLLYPGVANAQWNSPNAYGHSTGYGTVYGSYGLASTMQSMYNVARAQSQRTAAANPGGGAVPRASARGKNSASSSPHVVAPPARVVRNRAVFRADATVDTGKVLADALASTPEEKALIKQIYASTKATYETEAAARGWKDNLAGGLTFFTVAAMTVYHDAEEPSAEAANTHYQVLNAALDEVPDLDGVSNKDKQGFNNVMIGFGGMLLAIYTEARQNSNAQMLGDSKKLAGMLIEMVLKTAPENLRVENGQVAIK